MSFTAEGTIEIPTEEFFNWMYKNYTPCSGVEYQYGVPRVNKSNQTIEVDFAMGTETNPKEWHVKPDFLKQWVE